jgi:DNA-binding transcriptional ArsR family regulator
VASHLPGEDEVSDAPECVDHEGQHDDAPAPRYDDETVELAASLFRALGDVSRLRTMELLVDRELCVSEIAAASGELISTVSHRMRLLRSEGLVSRRRDGRHIYYALRDRHVYDLVLNALEHVSHEHG